MYNYLAHTSATLQPTPNDVLNISISESEVIKYFARLIPTKVAI